MTYMKPQITVLGDAVRVIQGSSNTKSALPIKDAPFPDEVTASYATEE
jgi:hypothetical protein